MPSKWRGDWRSPELPDRENFGRTAMDLPPETVYAQVLYQTGALEAMVRAGKGVLRHVKPHGMLYNRAAKTRYWRRRLPVRCGTVIRS